MAGFGRQKGYRHHGINNQDWQPISKRLKVDAHIKLKIEPAQLPPPCLLDEEPDSQGLYHCIRVRRRIEAPAEGEEDEKHDIQQALSPTVKDEDDRAVKRVCAPAEPAGIQSESVSDHTQPDPDQNVSQPHSHTEDDAGSMEIATVNDLLPSIKTEIDDDSVQQSCNVQDNHDASENLQTGSLADSSDKTSPKPGEDDPLPILSSVQNEKPAENLTSETLEFMMDHEGHLSDNINQDTEQNSLRSSLSGGEGDNSISGNKGSHAVPGSIQRESTPDYGQEHEEEEKSPPSSPDERWWGVCVSSEGSNFSSDNDCHMSENTSDGEPEESTEEPVLLSTTETPSSRVLDRLVVPQRGARLASFDIEHYRDILASTVAGGQNPFPARPSLRETLESYNNHNYGMPGAGLGSGSITHDSEPMSDPELPPNEHTMSSTSRADILGWLANTSHTSPDRSPTPGSTEQPFVKRLTHSRRRLAVPSHDRTTRSMGKDQMLFKQLPGYGTSIKNVLTQAEMVRDGQSTPPLGEESGPAESSHPAVTLSRIRRSTVGTGAERRRRKKVSRAKRHGSQKSTAAVVPSVVAPPVNKFLHLGARRRSTRSNSGFSTGSGGVSTTPRIASPLSYSVTTNPPDEHSHFGHLASPEPAASGFQTGFSGGFRIASRMRRAASAPVSSSSLNFGDLAISGDQHRMPLLLSGLGGAAACRAQGPGTTRFIPFSRRMGANQIGIPNRTPRYPASTMAGQQNRSQDAAINTQSQGHPPFATPGGGTASSPSEVIVSTTERDWAVANANRWIARANAVAAGDTNFVALNEMTTIASAATPGISPAGTTIETRSQDGGKYIQMPDGSWVKVADMAATARYIQGEDGKWAKAE